MPPTRTLDRRKGAQEHEQHLLPSPHQHITPFFQQPARRALKAAEIFIASAQPNRRNHATKVRHHTGNEDCALNADKHGNQQGRNQPHRPPAGDEIAPVDHGRRGRDAERWERKILVIVVMESLHGNRKVGQG